MKKTIINKLTKALKESILKRIQDYYYLFFLKYFNICLVFKWYFHRNVFF